MHTNSLMALGQTGMWKKTNSKMGRHLYWEGRIQKLSPGLARFCFSLLRSLTCFPFWSSENPAFLSRLKEAWGHSVVDKTIDRESHEEIGSVMPRALGLHPQTPSWFVHSSCLLPRKSYQHTHLYGLCRTFSSQF